MVVAGNAVEARQEVRELARWFSKLYSGDGRKVGCSLHTSVVLSTTIVQSAQMSAVIQV